MNFLEKKRSLDYKKVLSLVLALILVVIGYEAIQFRKENRFQAFEIIIDKNDSKNELLNKKSIMKIMQNHLGFDPEVSTINRVDFRSLEEKLKNNPYIEDAVIYVNSRNEIKIKITQKKPIARFKTNEVDFYVTASGSKVPLSQLASLRVPIITGNVASVLSKTKESKKAFDELISVINACNKDAFLTALIEQIDISNDEKITFIPKVGDERIVFGTSEDYQEKLEKLKKYYEWGKNQDGWNKYAYLNLEYKNQIALGK